MSKNILKLYIDKAQLNGVQKMDPFLVQCSDVVSTFGQVPEGRTACFCLVVHWHRSGSPFVIYLIVTTNK